LPLNDREKAIWLSNFSLKLSNVGASLGVLLTEVSATKKDADYFKWMLEIVEIFKTETNECIKYKDILRSGPLGTPLGASPTVPTLPVTPAVVPAGIFVRVKALVQRIKNHPNYTEAIGKDLGIIGAEQSILPNEMKPTLKLLLTGGFVEIQWTKGQAGSIRIEKLINMDTKFSLLTIATIPNTFDRTPINETAIWKYRAIYMLNDEPIGQYSDIAQIVVGSAV